MDPKRNIFVIYSSFFIPTEDAKRLAIKEEQYDPGYEDAYGGAYVPEGDQAQGQVNGHCTFASAGNTGNNTLMQHIVNVLFFGT